VYRLSFSLADTTDSCAVHKISLFQIFFVSFHSSEFH